MTTIQRLNEEYNEVQGWIKYYRIKAKSIKAQIKKEEERIEHRDKVVEELKRLDILIWNKYYPEDDIDNSDVEAYFLKYDIIGLLSERDCDIDVRYKEIEDIINSSEYADDINKEFSLKLSCYDVALLKRDLASALKAYRDVAELSSIFNYSFTNDDLKDFVALHRKNRFRNKIEKLLTNCNFHHECSMLCNKEYDELLNELNKGE